MEKQTIAFFDTKPYDKTWFDKLNTRYKLTYFEHKLGPQTARLPHDCHGVIAFVNDHVDAETIDLLYGQEVRVLAMRSAGYNNVDIKAAFGKIHVLRVPAYSPYAVAEHAMALLLTLDRKTHRAYIRTRDFNFSLVGLTGFDLHGKTVGVIGTGKIGQVFIDIVNGFGMRVLAYDPYPAQGLRAEYVDLPRLFAESDVISLHCPLTEETRHIINADALRQMKETAVLVNTSRGALIESQALLDALNEGRLRGAALDVYEEEDSYFFEDNSEIPIQDNVLALLVSRPNVILTSHQAFLTEEALEAIARTTLSNLDTFFDGGTLTNEVCYRCLPGGRSDTCPRATNGRCF